MVEITLGYILAFLAVIFILGMIFLLLIQSFQGSTEREVERVGIIEGAEIVEQQRSGRERWRRAEVEFPKRDLDYEEEINLETIQESGSRTVILPEAYQKKLTSPPPSVDVQEGRRVRVKQDGRYESRS